MALEDKIGFNQIVSDYNPKHPTAWAHNWYEVLGLKPLTDYDNTNYEERNNYIQIEINDNDKKNNARTCLNIAKSVLSNPNLKREYDIQLKITLISNLRSSIWNYVENDKVLDEKEEKTVHEKGNSICLSKKEITDLINEVLKETGAKRKALKESTQPATDEFTMSGLEKWIEKAEKTILLLKNLPAKKSSFIRLNYLTLILIYFTLVLIVLTIIENKKHSLNDPSMNQIVIFGLLAFVVAMWGGIFLGAKYSVERKKKEKDKNPWTHEELLGIFQMNIRKIKTLSGSDERSKLLIKELEDSFSEEINNQNLFKKRRNMKIVILVTIMLISLIGLYFAGQLYF